MYQNWGGVILSFFLAAQSFSQGFDCGTPALSLGDRNFSSAISQPSSEGVPITWEIPVRAVVFLDDNFTNPNQSITGFNAMDVESKLAEMSTALSNPPYSFHFYLCGDVIYITADQLHDGSISVTDFMYVDGLLNVYMYDGPGNAYADFPWYSTNGIYLNGSQTQVNSGTFLHELGHSVGLIHSFDPTTAYIIPATQQQSDFPSPNNTMGRELVIRNPVPIGSKPFHIPNADVAGDQITDTPPGCTDIASFFPSAATIAGCLDNDPNTPCANGCFDNDPNTPCSSGCIVDQNTCAFIGDYHDYNHDLVTDPNGNMVRNYMSYFYDCWDRFTPGQSSKVHFGMVNFFNNALFPNLCGTHDDRVEIRGTSAGLNYVSLKVTNTLNTTDIDREVRTMTDAAGDFSGRLWEVPIANRPNEVTVDVRRIKKHDIQNYDDDWTGYVNTFDLLTIQKHLLGAISLDGYSILAADANKSNSLTPTDIIELRKLILGIYPNGLPKYVQPYRFVPETVTLKANQQLQKDFDGLNNDDNPFTTLDQVSGLTVKAIDYCEPPYVIRMYHNSKRNGFDAVKIGDINKEWQSSVPPPDDCRESVVLSVPNVPVEQNETFRLNFRGTGLNGIAALQIGLAINGEEFELLGVEAENIPFFSESNNVGGGLALEGGDDLRLAWHSENLSPITLSEEEHLISLELKAKVVISNLGEAIKLQQYGLPTRVYTEDGDCTGEVLLVVDKVASERGTIDFMENEGIGLSINCIPNPAAENLTIQLEGISGLKTGIGVLSFYDAEGRLLFSKEYHVNKGSNSINIEEFSVLPKGKVQVLFQCIDGSSVSTKLIKQ